jgi:phosphoribosylamine---glycine ligase
MVLLHLMESTPASYPRLLQADKLDVMVVGRNGREHALAWKLAQSPRIGNLYVAPGIAGVESGVINEPLDGRDNPALVQFAQEEKVDLVVVGSISALERGLVDAMAQANIPAFGPTQSAMRIESSKPYAKRLMRREGILTADFGIFTAEQVAVAHEYVERHPQRLFVKAGGLASGEGSIACETPAEAHAAVNTILVDRKFGEAGDDIVIEDWVDGVQAAFSAFAAGRSYQAFPAQGESYKRRYDGDIGLNTGGMGTYAPADWFGPEQVALAAETIIQPTLATMSQEGTPFRGIMMPEFILTPDGFSTHEINARFGGPEAQVDMRYLRSDLLEVFVAAMTDTLDQTPLEWHPGYSIGVNTAVRGYPENTERGKRISGIDAANMEEGVYVFLNGVQEDHGELYTNGGRPLTVTAVGDTLSQARDRVYAALELIDYDGIDYRHDIGLRPSQYGV